MTRFLFWGERFRCGASPPSNPWFIPEKLQDDIEKEGVFLQQGDQGGCGGLNPGLRTPYFSGLRNAIERLPLL